tara:strand:- start:877 stop:999 length:123 start_codon:yes stop_codon:yes gene_type:complete
MTTPRPEPLAENDPLRRMTDTDLDWIEIDETDEESVEDEE